ncbi:hypothetical protein Tco_0519712 [Tanacetum coccineum]
MIVTWGLPAGIHGLFSGRFRGLAGRMVTLRVSTVGAKGVTTGTLVRLRRLINPYWEIVSPVLWVEIGEGWRSCDAKGVALEGRGSFWEVGLPEELSGVHDTFHVSNLKKYLADASQHVPLNEIKVDKTLRFVEEPVEIMDREIKSLKHSKISFIKVRWNSKRGPKFTWEREDYMKFKYFQLFVDRAHESAG